MTENTRRIIEQILAVPRGRVCSYRDIALKAGIPNGARQTARTLHSMSEKHSLPWHRIIRCGGQIALEGGGRELQITLLRGEGVKVSADGKVDMGKFGC
ncbi:MAG: MGMT family protein [Treponema sp.]|jgi:methylated-DNA-protein-cysteine methyltransferase-like protein|nr:MGMT family protein [Treponema sp.]